MDSFDNITRVEKNAPDKIYLDIIDLDSGYMIAPSFENNGGTEYIRKDTLLEWAKERYQQTISNVGCYTGHSVWQEVIDKLNEL